MSETLRFWTDRLVPSHYLLAASYDGLKLDGLKRAAF